ncbi:MAG: hypothetical protein E4H05_06630 [Acidimicrobiales bacterium]|nr:MAG: hypothetical protein E4H05_06630 [Acidimicrobiales bacterium]
MTAGLVAVSVMASWRLPEIPDLVAMAAPGALAAGVALGLDDEGFRFIRMVPTTALTRLGLRLAVLIPALIAATAVVLVVGGLLFDASVRAPSLGAAAALVAAAVAIEVWWSRHRPETAAEGSAAAVVAWSVSASILPDVAVLQAGANAWHTHALGVLGLSVVAAVVGSRGRAA